MELRSRIRRIVEALLLERETVLQHAPDEGPRLKGLGRRRRQVLVGQQRERRLLLEGALLVGGIHPGAVHAVEAALRRSLVLRDLHERLPDRAIRGLLGIVRIGKHEPGAEVRVVGNRQDVAAGAGIEAVLLQHLPEHARVVVQLAFGSCALRRLEVAERPPGHVLVREDDVAMEVRRTRHRRPLVGDERREVTGIVVLLRRVLLVLPDRQRSRVALVGVEAARHGYVRRHHADAGDQQEQRRLRDRLVERELHVARVGESARRDDAVQELALRQRVGGGRRVPADSGYAEPLRMIGDGGEVERPPELPGARGLAIDVDRRHPDLAAASKHVRIARPVHDVEDEGVDGVVGMDVEIAEERLPERIVGRTLLRRGVSCARRSGCDGEHQRDGDH